MDVKLAAVGRGIPGAAYIAAVRFGPAFLYALAALAVSTPSLAQEPDQWLGPDKPLHAFAAGWSAGAGYAVGIELGWDPAGRRGAAIGAGVLASLAKEALDRWTRGKPFSFKDLAADAVGIAAFVALTAAADH